MVNHDDSTMVTVLEKIDFGKMKEFVTLGENGFDLMAVTSELDRETSSLKGVKMPQDVGQYRMFRTVIPGQNLNSRYNQTIPRVNCKKGFGPKVISKEKLQKEKKLNLQDGVCFDMNQAKIGGSLGITDISVLMLKF